VTGTSRAAVDRRELGTATVEDGRDTPAGTRVAVTAKIQGWKPEEFLRTLVEAEIASRDASNVATRMRQAGFGQQTT
jgi:hypothetical protein